MSVVTRRTFLRDVGAAIVGAALASCAVAPSAAQRIPRVSVLGLGQRPVPGLEGLLSFWRVRHDEFLAALRELGYEDGRTIRVDWDWDLEPARQLAIVAQTAALPVDLIVASSTQAQRLAQAATSTIPIVMWSGDDPVEAGLVQSMARPGGNITGVTSARTVMTAKRLELLKESFPRISRVAIVGGPQAGTARRVAEETARTLGLDIATVQVDLASQMAPALDAASAEADAILVIGVPPGSGPDVFAFAASRRIPGLYPNDTFVENGGLMTYFENDAAISRRVARYVARILEGERPADMPVELPTEFDLVINLKTAKAQGLTIPQSVLSRATRVIE